MLMSILLDFDPLQSELWERTSSRTSMHVQSRQRRLHVSRVTSSQNHQGRIAVSVQLLGIPEVSKI